MAKIERFENILTWQEARELTKEMYSEFKVCKDYSFRDQIQRASTSIMNNIAEGFERGGNKEFKHFLFIAKGSAGEVRSQLIVAEDIGYIDKDKAQELVKRVVKISKLLSGLIKTL